MQPSEREQCRRRLYSRFPLVGSWQRRRAVERLLADGSAEAVRILEEAVVDTTHPGLSTAAFRALRQLAKDGNAPAQEALCRLVIFHDFPQARVEVRASRYMPHEETKRALFFFLTEQWDEYENLDFDHHLLRTAYENGSEDLRKRIALRARQGGRVEWVDISSGGRHGRRLGAMTDREWKTALTLLVDAHRWEDIWRLAQEAPARWSARFLRRLQDVPWAVPKEDQEGFNELTRLAAQWPDHVDLQFLFDCRATLLGHQDEVRCLVVSPAGDMLASGGRDKTVRLWSLPDGNPLRTLQGHREAVTCLALSPDGKILASGAKDGRVMLCRLANGFEQVEIKRRHRSLLCLAISPDSRVLAGGGGDGGVQLWELPTGRPLRKLRGHRGRVLRLAASPDGRLLASASTDCTVKLWSLPRSKLVKTLSGHQAEEADAVLSLAISPDGEVLASGGTDGTVHLWGLPGGSKLRMLRAHQRDVASLGFGPDGKILASGGGDNTIRFWDLSHGKMLQAIGVHNGDGMGLIVSVDGRFMASFSGVGTVQDHSVRLWSFPDGKALRSLQGHKRFLTGLVMSPDGQLLASADGDGVIRLWTAEISRLARLPVGRATLQDLAWVQERSRKKGLGEAEQQVLEFMAALMKWRRRLDIVVEDAGPRMMELGEFDIETEG